MKGACADESTVRESVNLNGPEVRGQRSEVGSRRSEESRRDMTRIARRFNAGKAVTTNKVPKGRLNKMKLALEFRPSLRDSNASDRVPGVETPGFFRGVPPGRGG